MLYDSGNIARSRGKKSAINDGGGQRSESEEERRARPRRDCAARCDKCQHTVLKLFAGSQSGGTPVSQIAELGKALPVRAV